MCIYLKYFQKYPNVGDKFSLVVAQHYFSPQIVSCNESPLEKNNLILVGSILHWADSMTHVCGAGIIEPSMSMSHTPKIVNCVRGPLTARYLISKGMDSPSLFGDPGILVSKIFPKKHVAKFKLGIIPHYIDSSEPWVKSCQDNDILILDVLGPLDVFLDQIQQCEAILSSSLHGIIFAHAYNVPALWIELSDRVIGNGFKFYDYYLSMGIAEANVIRMKVNESTDPTKIVNLAMHGNHSSLVSSLEEAIFKTKIELEK